MFIIQSSRLLFILPLKISLLLLFEQLFSESFLLFLLKENVHPPLHFPLHLFIKIFLLNNLNLLTTYILRLV